MKTQEKKETFTPVSIVIPIKNSASTILYTLNSISKQIYPIKELILVDNASFDNSVEKAREFSKRSNIPCQIIKRLKNKGVGASYNLGVKKASSSLVIFMHSDSSLPTKSEIRKLTEPFRKDLRVVASYSKVILPEKVWNSYNFWQKCVFARSVGKESPALITKFDCYKRDVYLRIGGLNTKFFGENIGIGSEDADLYLRLKHEGKIILSKAKVIHLHFIGANYRISDWVRNRKFLARSYGRLLRIHGTELPLATHGKGLYIPLGGLVFLIKPTLAIIPFMSHLHILGVILLLIYSFFHSKKMYATLSTLSNPRILLLLFMNIFLVYYETFWMLEAFLFVKKKV